MSLASQVALLATRVATEIKAVRSELAGAGGGTAAAVMPTSLTALGRMYASFARRDSTAAPVVSVGSSTMYGQGASTDARRTMNRLVATLQQDYPLSTGAAQPGAQYLNAVAGTTLPAGVQLVNAAVAGSESNSYLTDTTAAQVGALNPSVVVHAPFSNDYAANRNPTTFSKANLLAWANKIDAAVTNGRPPVHVLFHGHRRTNVSSPAFAWSAYGAAMAQLAVAEPARFVFVNAHAAYTRAGQDTAATHPFMDADRIHLSDSGHAFGAAVLRAALREDLDVNTTAPSGADPTLAADTTVPTISSFTATPASGQVSLAWAGSDNVGITRWVLSRAGTTVYDGTATSFTDTGRPNGTAITYSLVAYDAAGNASTTSTVTATPVAAADTTAPTISTFTATPGDGQVALAWAGSDNVAITRWLLTRGGTTVYDGTATSFTDTGRTNGTALSYSLVAYDAAGNASTAAAATATPAAAGGAVSDYTSGMLFDFDADTVAAQGDATKVASWTSQGGSLGALNLAQTTAANQPTVETVEVNGHAVLRFTGSASTRLLSASNAPVIPGSSVSYVYVFKRTGALSRAIGAMSSSEYHTLYDVGSVNGIMFNNAAVGTNGLTYGVSILNRWVVIIVSMAGAASKMVVGSEATITGTLPTAQATGISVGGSGSGSGFGTFDLAKYRAYDHALTDAEITSLRTYLNSRYALS